MKVFILLSVLAVALAKECGENQHYESCGTACPLTCANYDNPPVACILMCNPGCHCDEGYVKTKDGRCVKPETCPLEEKPVCGDNERYTTCGKACPLTCDNYQNPPKICPLMCIIGCECQTGFVKTRDGRCVKPEECPAQAPTEKSCSGQPDPGMCKAYMPMWYYDGNTGECEMFVYGGCQGNGNRYSTEEECLKQCSGVAVRAPNHDICSLPAVTGPCRASFQRFYFDAATKECKEFTYGGCLGNENNFKTEEGCKRFCGV